MRVWDVKHGNAIYIRTPNEKHIVIDLGVGDYSEGVDDRSPLETLANHYKIGKIDYLIITHPHKDHIKDILNLDKLNLGPRILNRPKSFDVNSLLNGASAADKPLFQKYIDLHNSYNTPLSANEIISTPENYGGLKIDFFANGAEDDNNLNNHSKITVIKYAGTKIVIPGDNEYKSLDGLMRLTSFKNAIADCDILIAPHHGRESAYHTEFVSHCNPRLTIISDGSICDTSANSKYSAATKRGWEILERGTWKKRYLLTTNTDGEVYIDFGTGTTKPYMKVEVK